MFGKLDQVEKRYERLQQELQDPEVTQNQKKYRNLMKELADLEPLVAAYRNYLHVQKEIKGSEDLLETEKDTEIRQMAKDDLKALELQKEELVQQLKILLLPKDPADEKSVILEIRSGAGGDEASLFADELFRAYTHFANSKNWKVNVVSYSPGNAGGCREVIASISGDRVFSQMKFESGVHRVQRVPKTETQGRVHTSTVTVAVLPEAEAVDIKVNPNDLRIDVYRSSGSGGQSVNTTDSAVRVTHIPTGLIVTCQEGKSQHSNKETALKVLYSRLLAIEEEKAQKEASSTRLAQIGTGDRSERIRTYNFPQTRITDHRIGLTIHQLNEVMTGDFTHLIDPIVAHYQAESLKHQSEI